MKTKILIVFIIFSINGLVSAQSSNLKRYSDYRNGFRGVAAAEYIGTIKEINSESSEINVRMLEVLEKFPPTGRTFDKISRNNYWLCQQALNEWDIKEDEVYVIMCADSMYAENAIIVIALIGNNGESFSWWGKTISINDSE